MGLVRDVTLLFDYLRSYPIFRSFVTTSDGCLGVVYGPRLLHIGTEAMLTKRTYYPSPYIAVTPLY